MTLLTNVYSNDYFFLQGGVEVWPDPFRDCSHSDGQNYSLRRHDNMNMRVPDKGRVKCTGFSYHGAKLFNMLPNEAKKCSEPESFKSQVKSWIWENIPSV